MIEVPRTHHQAKKPLTKPLTIYQYNVNKSKDVVMAQFMRDPAVLEADIIAIQEPWKNPFQSTTHHQQRTRMSFFTRRPKGTTPGCASLYPRS